MYGVVGLIVKMDDVGLALAAARSAPVAQRLGRGLVRAMPRLLAVISVVGIAAMLWVGGHILLVGIDDLGWHWLYDRCTTARRTCTTPWPASAPSSRWLVNTAISAVDRPGRRRRSSWR